MSADTISKKSTVTLGLVVGLIGFITVLSFRFGSEFERAAAEREAIRKDVAGFRAELATGSADRWPRAEARTYHDTIQRLNPDMEVPPIYGASK